MADDDCDVCDGTGFLDEPLTDRQRILARRFGYEVPDCITRPCSFCGEARRG